MCGRMCRGQRKTWRSWFFYLVLVRDWRAARLGGKCLYPLSPLVQLNVCLWIAGVCSCCGLYGELLVTSWASSCLRWSESLVFGSLCVGSSANLWDPGKQWPHALSLCLGLFTHGLAFWECGRSWSNAQLGLWLTFLRVWDKNPTQCGFRFS